MVWKGIPMKKLLFIVNPRAGKTKSRAPLFDAAAEFSHAGYLVNIFVTEAGGQARDMAARCGGNYDLIVCAGGDGTLNETLSGLPFPTMQEINTDEYNYYVEGLKKLDGAGLADISERHDLLAPTIIKFSQQ